MKYYIIWFKGGIVSAIDTFEDNESRHKSLMWQLNILGEYNNNYLYQLYEQLA